MKAKQTIFGIVTAAVLASTLLFPTTVFAASKASIKKTTYEGSGIVDVDFSKDVQYKNTKITVKDSSGKTYSATIRDKDEDDLEFRIAKYATGKTYQYTISGVRNRGTSSYSTLSGKVTIPGASSKAQIAKTKYDGGGKVEVDFKSKVQYKNAKVTVKDSKGKSYSASIIDRDDDELEFKIKGFKSGTAYSYTISGIRPKGASSYTSVSGKVSIPAAATKVKIAKTKYDGSGKVEVDFKTKVQYKNVKVTVKDSKGKSYSASILDRDNDELEFRIKNYKAGTSYTYTISGIRASGSGSYASVSGKVSIPAAPKVKVSLDKAKNIALNHAKLKSSQVRFTKAKLDKDDGISVYEIEFRRGSTEYEYEIHATSGKILDWDKDIDD